MARKKFMEEKPIAIEEKKVSIEEPIVEEAKAEEPETNTVQAIVSGVETALNIRKKPEIKPNNQIGIVGKGTKIIVVDPEKPVKKNGEEWYKVILNGEPGYAMKKFIKVI